MLGLFPELLLSWVILILVVYGLRERLLKVSILMLILIGLISLWLRGEFGDMEDYGVNGLLLSSD